MNGFDVTPKSFLGYTKMLLDCFTSLSVPGEPVCSELVQRFVEFTAKAAEGVLTITYSPQRARVWMFPTNVLPTCVWNCLKHKAFRALF